MFFPHGCPCIGCISGTGGRRKKACSRGMMGLKPSFSQRVASAFNHRLTIRMRLLQLDHTVDWNDGMASLIETSYGVRYYFFLNTTKCIISHALGL